MAESQQQWERLAELADDPAEMRQALLDLGAFLVAFDALEVALIHKPRSFLAMDGDEARWAQAMSDRDRTLAFAPLDKRRGQIRRAAIAWFHEMGALNDEDVLRLRALIDRRNVIAHAPLEAMVAILPDALLSDLQTIQGLTTQLDRWWILEVEAAINPEILGGKRPEAVDDATNLYTWLVRLIVSVAQRP